ncbi:outer membrane beta-barrel protein, partial [Niastella populi]|uniref:outer membrane beta-barrel protein n=1 Tax=Niastella populi TaxID=550983 RepID=UPI001054237E
EFDKIELNILLKTVINFYIISCFSLPLFAQTDAAWLKGGVNFANVSYNKNGEVDKATMLTSFHVGIMGDISLAKVLAIQPGILFTGKGSKIQSGNTNDNFYYKVTANAFYIEILVNVAIKIPLESLKSNFFFGVGPYIAIGVGGKRKIEGRNLAVSYSPDGSSIYCSISLRPLLILKQTKSVRPQLTAL